MLFLAVRQINSAILWSPLRHTHLMPTLQLDSTWQKPWHLQNWVSPLESLYGSTFTITVRQLLKLRLMSGINMFEFRIVFTRLSCIFMGSSPASIRLSMISFTAESFGKPGITVVYSLFYYLLRYGGQEFLLFTPTQVTYYRRFDIACT